MSPALVALAFGAAVAASPAPVAVASSAPDSPWLYLIGGGGLLGILTWASKLILDIRSGRAQQGETRAADVVLQRDTAWRERDGERRRAQEEQRRADIADRRADCEARNVRRVLDYSARLRRMLIDQGVDMAALPGEPEIDDCAALHGDDEWPESPPERRRVRR